MADRGLRRRLPVWPSVRVKRLAGEVLARECCAMERTGPTGGERATELGGGQKSNRTGGPGNRIS